MTLLAIAVSAVAILNIKPVLGQDLPATIVGCLEIGCPVESVGTSSKCTVVDKTYRSVGLARIPGVSSNLTGVSWTEGVTTQDDNGNGQNYNTNFYFGAPPGQNLTGTGACAVFFNDISDAVVFPPKLPDNSTETSQGTCEEAMGSQCVNALTKRATNLDINGLSTSEACSKLQTAFNENLDSACERVAGSGKVKWSGISVKALTGQDASPPISTSQNSSSNCWPVLPKENSLTLVSSIDSPGDNSVKTALDKFFGITPILTLFYPGNGSLITKSEAQITCMKTIGLGVGDNATMTGTGGDKGMGSSFGPSPAVVIFGMGLLNLLLVGL